MKSLSQSVISSSSLLGAVKIIEKSLGLISTLVLARLLTPNDFGLVATVMIFIYFFESIGHAGGTQYLIQKQTIDDDDINSAFTLNLITKGFFFIILILAIPPITDFYNNPALSLPLYFCSLLILIRSLSNPGQILLQKSLEYRLIAKYTLITKVVTFIVVLLTAYLTKSYWALLIGDLLNVLLITIASYWIHPYRPKLSVKRIKEQFGFSQWIFLRNIVSFFRNQGDRILISKFFGITLTGEFHIARHLISLPSQDIIVPAIDPLTSAFARIKHDRNNLNYQITLSLIIATCIVAPVSSFFLFNSDVLILTLFGHQWQHAASILSGLSPLVTTTVLFTILSQACIATNRPKILAAYDLASVILIFPILLVSTDLYIGKFALLRSLLDVVSILLLFAYLVRLFSIRSLRQFTVIPVIITIALISGFASSYAIPIEMNIFAELILVSLAFVACYIAILIAFHYGYYKRTVFGIHIHQMIIDNIRSIFHFISKHASK